MSIKNKLVTAVTTAGLLAGLFGSAFVPVAQGAAGVLDATETTFTDDDALEGSGTSSSPLEMYAVTMADLDETAATLTFDLEDSTGTNIDDSATISTSGACELDAGAATNADSYTVVVAAGALVVNLAADTTSSSGLCTLTVTVNGGTETVYIKVFGPVTSCTLENAGISKLAAGNASEDEAIELTCTDASGYDISGNATALAAELADADVAWAIGSDSVGAVGDVAEAGNNQTFDLAATACDVGDEGESYSVRANVTNGVASVVSTGYVTVDCTGAAAVTLTDITLSASTVTPGGTIYAYFHFDDGNGLGLGYGGTVDFTEAVAGTDDTSFTGSRDLAPAALEAIWTNSTFTFPVADLVVGTAGNINDVVRVAITAANKPGNYAITIDVDDTDATSAAVDTAETWVLNYVVTDPSATATGSTTIAASVNAAKRIGSFTLSAAANKLVTITVERISDGKVWTYYRKANASGVATFTIRKFGRFDVFASYGDDVTDTVRMRRLR